MVLASDHITDSEQLYFAFVVPWLRMSLGNQGIVNDFFFFPEWIIPEAALYIQAGFMHRIAWYFWTFFAKLTILSLAFDKSGNSLRNVNWLAQGSKTESGRGVF